MRDVIQKIIATESEARQKVQAAESEAERIILESRKHAQELVEAARQTALLDAVNILTAALEKAEAEKKQRLADAAAEMDNQIRLDGKTMRHAVNAVVAACTLACNHPSK